MLDCIEFLYFVKYTENENKGGKKYVKFIF